MPVKFFFFMVCSINLGRNISVGLTWLNSEQHICICDVKMSMIVVG
jgi:hypothetical protein